MCLDDGIVGNFSMFYLYMFYNIINVIVLLYLITENRKKSYLEDTNKCCWDTGENSLFSLNTSVVSKLKEIVGLFKLPKFAQRWDAINP